MKFSKKNRKGMVLILTFIIIITLTAIVAAFLYLTSTQLKGSAYDAASHQALWLAEAGIQQAISYIRYTAGVTTDPITGNLGSGSYTATIAGSGDTRTISSTGTVGVISRTITQTVTVKNPYQTGYGVGVGVWNEQ